jgi:3-deoxy-7-phosphoheptulonate synthase
VDAKLAKKNDQDHRTIISITPNATCGGRELLIVGGPCTVESAEQMDEVATIIGDSVQALRGGVYKPRTSPYSFQGMGVEGLEILAETRRKHGLPVITEVMSVEQLPSVVEYADVLQIGSRNMQNYELLKAVGQTTKVVLLKRGLSATIEEVLLAAEYILAQGNPNVILCERGIRSFDSYTRNVLDLGAVVALKQLTHLPVIVDPSHAAGKRELVADLARAAIACGADGLIIECHPEPEKSVSDARQALSLEDMVELVRSLKPIAEAVGRHIPTPTKPQLSKGNLEHANQNNELTHIRKQIDEIDLVAASLLEQRLKLARAAGSIKSQLELPIRDAGREDQVLQRVSLSSDQEIAHAVRSIYRLIIHEATKIQATVSAETLRPYPTSLVVQSNANQVAAELLCRAPDSAA